MNRDGWKTQINHHQPACWLVLTHPNPSPNGELSRKWARSLLNGLYYTDSYAMASFGTTACQSFPIVMTCHGFRFAALIRCSKIDLIENELYPGKPAPTSVSYNAILPLISQLYHVIP